MRYYFKQPKLGYIVIPVIGALVSSAIVIPIGNIVVDGELSTLATIIVLFGLYMLFLLILLYISRFKDYVELSRGIIQIVYDERKNKPTISVFTSDILLLEIITHTEPSSDEYYLIYPKAAQSAVYRERTHYIGCYQVPLKDMLDFCAENNIVPVYKTINRFQELESVELQKKSIKLKFFKKRKKLKIAANEITSIKIIAPHPISISEDYYRLGTLDGKEYDFGLGYVDQEKLVKYGQKHGFSVDQY